MVWIPGGEFSMGSTDPLARPDEQPVHRVRVHGFWADITEVTNAQFAAFVAATGYKTVAERRLIGKSCRSKCQREHQSPPMNCYYQDPWCLLPAVHPLIPMTLHSGGSGHAARIGNIRMGQTVRSRDVTHCP
jgi:formylglycine-generating enzyme required for sulfatase activity